MDDEVRVFLLSNRSTLAFKESDTYRASELGSTATLAGALKIDFPNSKSADRDPHTNKICALKSQARHNQRNCTRDHMLNAKLPPSRSRFLPEVTKIEK